jgi:hypothetical protein
VVGCQAPEETARAGVANFSLKLSPGEKVLGQFHCTVAPRAETMAPARDRALVLVTTRRFFVLAERRLYLSILLGATTPDGRLKETRTPLDVAQLESRAEDVLLVVGQDVYRRDGAVQVSVRAPAGAGTLDLFLRCLDDLENVQLLGLLTDLRLSAQG